MRHAEAILARFPGPVTLYPSRLKMLALFAAALAFVIGGLWVLNGVPGEFGSGERLMIWLGILFFGGCVLIAASMLLPGSSGLTLTADGFEARNLFRDIRASWTEANHFYIEEIFWGEAWINRKLVAFDIARGGERTRGRTLPDTYRMPPDDLAWLMSQWRLRALGTPRRVEKVERSETHP
jgi:hypothetical protein